MNNPHVEKLFYRVIIPEQIDYDNAPSISGETDKFKWHLSKEQLILECKSHIATEKEARTVADSFFKAWEVSIGLRQSPQDLSFKFQSSSIIDRSPPPESGTQTLKVMGSGGAVVGGQADVHVSYAQFPTPYRNFEVSPEVEMMFLRYKLYHEGRESLLGMAYWCLTVVEYSARGREEAAEKYRIDLRVLRKLGELCGNRGGINEARKLKGQAGVTPLKPAEREWIKSVIKTLMLRVGEYAFDPTAKLPQITMSDFPSTT